MAHSRSDRPVSPGLTDLEISGLGIIDRVHLELAPGFNVVTGETGAGKTMVVTGLQWLLGARADRDKVRDGARSAMVQARFAPAPTTAVEWTDAADELLVTREVGGRGDDDRAAGRSRARLSGRLAPVATLAEVLTPVVEIHSQDESVRLADAETQRRLLDRFGGGEIDRAKTDYRSAYRRWHQAVTATEKAEESFRDDVREADRLRFEVTEIAAVDPAPDEETALDEAIGRLEHVEALRTAAATIIEQLTGEGGARDALGSAVRAMRGAVPHDRTLTEPSARLEAALAEVQEIVFEVSGYADGLDADPAVLDHTLARRAAIGNLLRKYGPTTAEVLAYQRQATARLATVDGGEERLARLRSAAAESEADMRRTAEILTAARTSAAGRLAETVDTHLVELSMPEARTSIVVHPATPGPDGCDRVEFLLAAHKGQPDLPLSRAASGGERSRVALAVKVSLADVDDTPIMVFDEVDVGIGGQTALAVGRKLARLARGRQVLCVTHLAQLAAFADAHFVVTKQADDGAAMARVERLDDTSRATELSRMLAGVSDSEAALSHATELLDLSIDT